MWSGFCELHGIIPVTSYKKYRQLKLEIYALQGQYTDVVLSFRVNGNPISGILKGSLTDWTFTSDSPAFKRLVPSGMLHKYTLWVNRVPKGISKLYSAIIEAGLKAGYELEEKEEEQLN